MSQTPAVNTNLRNAVLHSVIDAGDALAIVVGVGIMIVAGLAIFGHYLRKKQGGA
jgi:hypothetical protein